MRPEMACGGPWSRYRQPAAGKMMHAAVFSAVSAGKKPAPSAGEVFHRQSMGREPLWEQKDGGVPASNMVYW